MKVERTLLRFTYLRKTYSAEVNRFQPAKTPMVWVCLDPKAIHSPVFVYYETAPDELYWFDLPNKEDQRMAAKIAALLLDGKDSAK